MRRWVVLASLLVSGPAGANDSSALLEAGGITLTKSDSVVMESEELWISRRLVRVSYVFRNTSSDDVNTRVAFPLPGLNHCNDDNTEYCEGDIQMGGKLPNWMAFKLTVDGKRRSFQTEQRFEKKGEVAQRFVTHHWEQRFPKDRPVTITHEYVPVAGGFFSAAGDPAFDKEMAEKYCVGPKLLGAMKKRETFLWAVHYILKTGANWKGPIKRFKLTIAKDSPKDKVSVCLPDTKRASDKTFEVVRQDFAPTDDLRILFIPGG